MFQADFLRPGDRIRIVSPAGKIQTEKVMPSVELLQKEGFEVLTGKHLTDTHFQFAGTDENRLQDLQEALDDPQCKAIICSRGGYGTIRIADQLDFSTFRENPKWVIGFSDITILHTMLQNEGFCSIHGPMPAYYLKGEKTSESFRQLVKLLAGNIPAYAFESHPLNRSGKASGKLCGGNLSIIYSLLGTTMEPNTEGKILFIEDLSEYLYHLDRMMHSLKYSGKLKNLKALLVGSFTKMKDNDLPFGKSVEEIIMEAVEPYHYPVFFNCPSGHIDENMPLVFGQQYELEDVSGKVILTPAP